LDDLEGRRQPVRSSVLATAGLLVHFSSGPDFVNYSTAWPYRDRIL